MRSPLPEPRRLGLLGTAAVAGAMALGGCGLEVGAPWGIVEPALSVAFEPPASRLDGARLKTSRDYRIELTRLDLEVASFALASRPEGGAAFDPQNPPAGYSLCHNGHCHSADGRLVDYDEIARELALVSGGPPVVEVAGASVELGIGARVEVALEGCGDAEQCWVLEPSVVSGASVKLTGGRLVGTAFDARSGEAARLPAEGVAFDVALDAVEISAPLDEAFGPDDALRLEVEAVIEVPAALFDAIDWATAEPSSLGEALTATLEEETRLVLTPRRRD